MVASPTTKDPVNEDTTRTETDTPATDTPATDAPAATGGGGGGGESVVPALMKTDSSAVLNVIKLLRMIALDGFKSCTLQGKSGNREIMKIIIIILIIKLEIFREMTK